ncbi:LysR family transcriptional regulator [Microbacterium thalassium]|nr:LysR family transcriptional regulator [Microbacterium thalassium]GLK25925.1 transcriptional regulator [Microbacterium thalassium]
MFDLRRLRMLHELALRGTIGAVADALSYSPSTISQQLSQLEKEAGVPLLAPDGRRVRLTEHGELLVAHAADALARDEEVRGALDALQPSGAPVRMAVMQTVVHGILPVALSLLTAREPKLRIEVSEAPPEEGLFEVSARRFDLAVAEQYPGQSREHRPGLERATLGRDPIRLALPPGDDARGLADLRERPWILEPAGTAARQWAVQQCRAAGFEPDVRFEVADLMAHAELIAAGHAVGLLPDLMWAGSAPRVRLVDLPDAPAREVFTVVRRSSTSRAAIRAVRDALRDAFDAAPAPAGQSS